MSVSDFDSDGVDSYAPLGMDPMGDPPAAAPAAGPATVSGSPSAVGWPSPRAPNGRVLPVDLSGLDEDKLERTGDKAAIYAVGNGPADFHPEREPLILVHGIEGDPKDLQAIVNRFKDDPKYQVYVLCYDDYHRETSLNGKDMAEELRTLQCRTLGPGRNVTIVAHSMGGIVTRQALDELAAGPGKGIEKFGNVRFLAADTPWHGWPGPSDQGVQGVFMDIARPFMPAGLTDMRGQSAMFAGDPKSSDPAARAGLLNVELPDNVETHLVFAQQGNEILHYGEGFLAPLASDLVGLYRDDKPVSGEPRLMNYWKAILSSSDYDAFADEMRDLADAGKLDENAVNSALSRYYPTFPGDHTGLLAEHPGERSFLDYLTDELKNG
jgi:pimeloyl-ACP methyl ester carboxylesterase